jgi:uncharacterized protein (DUF427 family)
MQAIWNGTVIAESDDTVIVEGNHYFPAESLRREFFEPSDHSTICSWKGTAGYLDVVVNGKRNEHAAWLYADPLPEAEHVRDRVAFWQGIEVVAGVSGDEAASGARAAAQSV